MRKLFVVLMVLLAMAGAIAWVAFNDLGVVVKWAIEHYGPRVAGVDVNVGEVQVSPRTGRGMVRGLELANPPGFGSPRAARFGEIRVAIDPATITSDVIHIRELVIEAPQVTYERGSKQTNLDAIQSRIEAHAKRAASDAGGVAERAGLGQRRFVIDRLVIHGGRVTMTNAALRGQGLGFDLPDIQLRDIGADRGGVTASEAAAIVASALQQRIAQKVLTNVDALRQGGLEGAIDALKGLVK